MPNRSKRRKNARTELREITEDEWAELYYHSMYRLSPGADFADGRAAVVSTATVVV